MSTNASPEYGSQLVNTATGDHPVTESSRAQSEPLAALAAVSLVCLVVSAYIVLMSDIVGTTGTERSVDEPTADAVWQDVSDDGMFDTETSIREAVGPETLPEGYNVAVAVTYIDGDGKRIQVGEETFDESGDTASLPVPGGAERVTRAVTVRVGPGDKRPGRFTIEVWK
jgi:hypothetical protein